MQTSACTQYGIHNCKYIYTSASDIYNHMPYTQQSLGNETIITVNINTDKRNQPLKANSRL